MRKSASWLALAALALSPVWAESKLEPPDTERYLRWGPVRARPGFALSNLGYDSNILLSPDGTQIPDITATLTPKLDGLMLFGHRAFLTFLQRFDYKGYVGNPEVNFLDNTTRARVTLPFRGRELGVFVDAAYLIAHQRPVDLVTARPKSQDVNGGLGVIVSPGWKTEVELAVHARSILFTDDQFSVTTGPTIGDRLDRDETGASLDSSIRLRGRTKLLLTGLWRDIQFDNPFEVDGRTIARDSTEWRAMVGAEFEAGGSLVGRLLIGWDQIGAESPELKDFSQMVGEASLRYRLNSRTRFELEATRLPGFAVYGANSYYLLWDARFNSVYYFNRVIGLDAGIGWGRLTFPDSINLLGREDALRTYELGTRFRLMENSIGRRVEYGFKIRYHDRTSSVPFFDRSATSVGFDANLGF